MQFVSLFVDDAGQVRCCRSQDRLGPQGDAPKMFNSSGEEIPLMEITVGAVETLPDGEHPVDVIPQRYEVAIQDDGPILRLKAGAKPVPGIVWGFPRAAADVPAWLDELGFSTLPQKVQARARGSKDRQTALRESGITQLASRAVHRVPLRLRAWLMLTSPAVAQSCGLDVGVSLTAMLHAERNRIPPDHPFKSRLSDLERLMEEDKAARRVAVFKARRRRQDVMAARETQAMIEAAQVARASESIEEGG